MLGRSHLLLATAGYVALLARPVPTPLGPLSPPLPTGPGLDGPAALAVGAAAVALGSLAPDLDRAGSTIARVAGLPTRAIAWIVQRSLGHRGPLHSALSVALVGVLGETLGVGLGVRHLGSLLAFGWASHLLLDALTRRGVPLLWPVRLRVRLPPGFATGSLLEQGLLAAGLAICGLWAVGAWPAGSLPPVARP